MYAGITIRSGSGKIIGVHQKIDRIARRQLKKYLPKSIIFPGIRDIIHFEGNNGPDGLKHKCPSVDQTWYFIDPTKPEDRGLIEVMNDHIYNLTVALRNKNEIRAAFEAAWLAHAIVDGLTPAHHYPLADKIEELWGKPQNERNSIREKNIIRGDSLFDTLSKNWEYWGAGGVFTTHGNFEIGSASAIATENFKDFSIDNKDIRHLSLVGFEKVFIESLHKVNNLKMYEKLGKSGWTQSLAKQTREVLIPEMINLVFLAWYQSAMDASGKE